MPGKIVHKYGKIFVEYEHNGKRTSQVVPSEKVGYDVIKRIDFELTEKIPDLQFYIYAEKYLKSAKIKCKPSTYGDYKSIIDNHLQIFRNKQVDQIKKSDIRIFLQSKLEQKWSLSTVKHMKVVISNILWLAFEEGVIHENPAINLRNIFPKKTKTNKKFLTKKEVARLLEAASVHKPKHYPFLLLLSRTGMRLGEAIALKWKDIDLKNRTIYLKRSIVRCKIGTPKNHEERKIEMSKDLKDVLSGMKKESEWIFPGKDINKPMNADAFRNRTFKPLVKKANLPESTRIHDLRHAYASILIQNGINF